LVLAPLAYPIEQQGQEEIPRQANLYRLRQVRGLSSKQERHSRKQLDNFYQYYDILTKGRVTSALCCLFLASYHFGDLLITIMLTHLPQLEGNNQQNDRYEHVQTLSIRQLKKSIFPKSNVVKKTPLQFAFG